VFWGSETKGDRTVVARFLSRFPLPAPAAVEGQRGRVLGSMKHAFKQ
jgi:hypothetical protein